MALLNRWPVVVVMLACMLLLTGANFLVFPDNNKGIATEQTMNDQQPVSPEEEKSRESKSLSNIQEEYHHCGHFAELSWFNQTLLTRIHLVEKLPSAVTREVYSPPKA